MIRRALLALALLLLCPSTAGAVQLVGANGEPVPGPYQGWADRAKVPTYQGRVKLIMDDACGSEGQGCADVWASPPEIHLNCSDPSQDAGFERGYTCRRALLHELGHVYDLLVLDDSRRARFAALFHRPEHPWCLGPIGDQTDGGDDSNCSVRGPHARPLDEWFAEAYRLCAIHPKGHLQDEFHVYQYEPTRRQHLATCRIIRGLR